MTADMWAVGECETLPWAAHIHRGMVTTKHPPHRSLVGAGVPLQGFDLDPTPTESNPRIDGFPIKTYLKSPLDTGISRCHV